MGELVTSLDMGGCSLTVMWLDDGLERAWEADAYAPAFRKVAAGMRDLQPIEVGAAAAVGGTSAPKSSDASRALLPCLVAATAVVRDVLHINAAELGEIDAIAGDGDHGRGMVKGVDAAADILNNTASGGIAWNLRQAGREWAARAGGTSGVLWGAGLEAAADEIRDDRSHYGADSIVEAVEAFQLAIQQLGGAQPGDKTLVDALVPFAQVLRLGISRGDDLGVAWARAANIATNAAVLTASLSPKKGRARPLAERSIGSPDAGATSFALIVNAVGRHLETLEVHA